MERVAKATGRANRAVQGRRTGWLGRGVWLGLAFLLALAGGPTGRCQSQQQQNYGIRPSDINGLTDAFNPYRISTDQSMDDFQRIMLETRLRALNLERQKQLVADTNKLLKLVKELNEEIASENTGNLSGDQLRKVAEIEKLARSVKERMVEGLMRPTPEAPPPSSVLYPSHY